MKSSQKASNSESYDVRVLAGVGSGLKFTESPRWHRDKLWFLDIHDKRVKTIGLDGVIETSLDLPFIPNGFGFSPEGTITVGDAFQRKIYRVIRGDLQLTADISGLTKYCLSDGIVDAGGRLYIGDIGYDFNDPTAEPVDSCVIVRVDPDGRATVAAEHLSFPNGMVVSSNGRMLVVAETTKHRLTAFDIQRDGALGNRRLWAQLPDTVTPDGICLDAGGGIWCANPTGGASVVRVLEGGEITDRIELPTKAYAVALGGPAKRHLFICASDSHAPEAIRKNPTASIRVAVVKAPGSGTP